MSTVGAGTVAVGAGGLAAMAVVGVVAGAGIVIAKGIMWCGEKIDENYQQACKEWTDLANASRAQSRANVEDVSTYLNSQLEFLSVSEFATAPQNTRASVSQQELDRAISLAKAALTDSNQIQGNKAETERKLQASRLRAEIKAGRGTLPATIIAEAEAALHGTTREIASMLKRLEDAWNTLNNAPAQQAHTILQTQQLLTLISTRLRAIDGIMRDSGATRNLDYQRRLRQLENQVIEARDELNVSPGQAYAQATRTQRDTDTLLGEVSSHAHRAWNAQSTQINQQLGTLQALSTMLQEAEAIQLADAQRLAGLRQRIALFQQRANLLLQRTSQQMQDDLTRLTTGVELLRQEVFTLVKSGQQQTIATLIQTTLNELGFTSEIGEAPEITRNGEVTRVEVMASREKTTGEREDRLITFDISREGRVSYDLAGYVGKTCLADANKIFAALHKKGVYLMNEQAMDELHRLPAENLVAEIMQQERFKLTLNQNKTQAEMAENLKGVLEDMGYPNIRVSSIGGSIELEAFEGNMGYRVIMSPEGEVQILKDASQTDISEDQHDSVAAASRTVQEQSQEQTVKKRSRAFMASRKGRLLSQ
ncbi:MAG TPA: hypothetical protein VL485_33465 [Ktedonobacteraceae bacterium]|nr:hypothetical protein [Ktedonobacteraceae bacterium]